MLNMVFIPIIVGDSEAITAKLERIECKELREKLLSTFAIHMNTKDYGSTERQYASNAKNFAKNYSRKSNDKGFSTRKLD